MPRPTSSAVALMPLRPPCEASLVPYHSQYRTSDPRGTIWPSGCSQSSCAIAHQPIKNGDDQPQSAERSLDHSFGSSVGRKITFGDQQSKNAPSTMFQSPKSQPRTCASVPKPRKRSSYPGSARTRTLLSHSFAGTKIL